MEIRKADSKGRVTVGRAESNYYVRRYENGAVLLEPLEAEYTPRFPVRPEAIDYLASKGIDPKSILAEGLDRYGYFLARSSDGRKKDWPDAFDWDEFMARV